MKQLNMKQLRTRKLNTKKLNTKDLKGLILFDIHYPVNIDLGAALKNAQKDNDIVILGGDILDMKYLHGLNGKKAHYFDPDVYEADIKWVASLCKMIRKTYLKKGGKLVYLQGNHEERMNRWIKKYPTYKRYAFSKHIKPLVNTYIPYGGYESYYILGDSIITHGTVWTDAHAKRMLASYGRKVLYGHCHDFQVYSDRTHNMNKHSKFAMSCGCLCTKAPDWKNSPNRWVNMYVPFVVIKGILIPKPYLLEEGINY